VPLRTPPPPFGGVSGADPRAALLAVLIQGEITAAAAGDAKAAGIAHDAAGVFCEGFKTGMRERFDKQYKGLGARVMN